MSEEETDGTVEKLSLKDAIQSLTGYEELKIEEHFGAPFGSLNALAKMKRALIFIARTRAGDKPTAAFKHAMTLRLVEVNETFVADDEDEDDFDPNDPDTERGKDDSLSD